MRKYEKPILEDVELLLTDVILASFVDTDAPSTSAESTGGGLIEDGEDNLD